MPLSAEVEQLGRRIRGILADRPEVTERNMFGGLCFMLNGNMLVGPIKGGGLLVRVGKQDYDAALGQPGAGPMTFTGREMKGYVEVEPDALETEESLAAWIDCAEKYVRTLPPK